MRENPLPWKEERYFIVLPTASSRRWRKHEKRPMEKIYALVAEYLLFISFSKQVTSMKCTLLFHLYFSDQESTYLPVWTCPSSGSPIRRLCMARVLHM